MWFLSARKKSKPGTEIQTTFLSVFPCAVLKLMSSNTRHIKGAENQNYSGNEIQNHQIFLFILLSLPDSFIFFD